MEPDDNWQTDPALLQSIPGADAITDWFGFFPSFHDAELLGLEMTPAAMAIRLRTHRMTSETDANGFFVLDRHADVTLRLTEVTGLRLAGCCASIITLLRIRYREADQRDSIEWHSCAGPDVGDYEIAIETSYGLYGSIFAKRIELELIPLQQA